MAVYTKLSKKDAAWIAARWGLGAPRELVGIAEGSVNTNYRMVTEQGTFFVRLDETRKKPELEAEGRLVAWLAEHRFPTPEPRPDAKGRRLAVLHRKPLAVFPFLAGKTKKAELYDRGELFAAGGMLARLHIASAGFSERLPNRFGISATAARWARIRSKARIPQGELREIDGAVASFSREPAPLGPAGIVHGDWFADNLLFERGEIVGVLDFEAAATDALAFDLATAINALCWKPSTPNRFDARRVQALLDGYEDAGGPAAPDDDALRYWLRASALRFAVTRVQDFRLKKSSLRVEKDYRDFLKRLRWWSR